MCSLSSVAVVNNFYYSYKEFIIIPLLNHSPVLRLKHTKQGVQWHQLFGNRVTEFLIVAREVKSLQNAFKLLFFSVLAHTCNPVKAAKGSVAVITC